MCLMQHHLKERIEVKFEFFRILEQAKLSEREIKSLYDFFDKYLKLTKEEEKKLMMKIKQNGKIHE